MEHDGVNIAYDITHLVARTGIATPTGIDRVDAALASALSTGVSWGFVGLQYGFGRPYLFPTESVAVMAEAHAKLWHSVGGAQDPAEEELLRFIEGVPQGFASAPILRARRLQNEHSPIKSLLRHARLHDKHLSLKPGTIYVNAAQYLLEIPLFTTWLKRRADIKPVFFIHDTIPLDFPEYFRRERSWRFPRILRTALTHASAILTSSQSTAARIEHYRKEWGFRDIPIIAEPLPPSDLFRARVQRSINEPPYVVMIGTIEPRKNHIGILHLWRRLIQQGRSVPKLVILGRLGWENEGVLALLNRSALLRGHVMLASGLGDEACLRLLRGARALLSPSFAEGYGIPIVEALSAGVPVIASDTLVHREISQGCALFCDPLDGPAWEHSITSLLNRETCDQMSRQAAQFKAPTWDRYVQRVVNEIRRL